MPHPKVRAGFLNENGLVAALDEAGDRSVTGEDGGVVDNEFRHLVAAMQILCAGSCLSVKTGAPSKVAPIIVGMLCALRCCAPGSA